jgi:serine/threonine-protein kinase RsbW
MITLRVRLNADAEVSGSVAEFVAGLAQRAGLTPTRAYRLRLAVDEITTNVVLHGYREGRGAVDLIGGIEEDRVWVRIEDDAPAFDPRTHDPTPRLAAGPTRCEEGGLGLFLALSNVDEFAYEHAYGRNRNTLIVRRAAADADAGEMEGDPDARDAGIGRR